MADVNPVTTSAPSVPPTTTLNADNVDDPQEATSIAQVSSSIASEVQQTINDPDTTTTINRPSDVTVAVTESAPDPTTVEVTSIVSVNPTNGAPQDPVVVVVTSTSQAAPTAVVPTPTAADASASETTTAPASLSNNGSDGDGDGGGLSTGGRVAIAVVVPVVVVALLLLAGIFLWRRRKQKKAGEEARRKEVEDYGFNPNNDPTLPAVAASEAGGTQMTEDSSSGYRGWGTAAAAGAAYSNRKTSTTVSGSNGHTQGQPSDSGSGLYANDPNNPNIDSHSGDPLVGGAYTSTHNNRGTLSSDDLGALGSAPLASTNRNLNRGPSNASSRYSNTARSEGSVEPVPELPASYSSDYGNPSANYGYSQAGPYGDGSYGGAAGPTDQDGMPVVRDVSARRNTRIEQPTRGFQQGNSGIAQNF
ncbi:hypothetical protein MBLNU230_g1638t1 [Neophaeotheca triangularis]